MELYCLLFICFVLLKKYRKLIVELYFVIHLHIRKEDTGLK